MCARRLPWRGGRRPPAARRPVAPAPAVAAIELAAVQRELRASFAHGDDAVAGVVVVGLVGGPGWAARGDNARMLKVEHHGTALACSNCRRRRPERTNPAARGRAVARLAGVRSRGVLRQKLARARYSVKYYRRACVPESMQSPGPKTAKYELYIDSRDVAARRVAGVAQLQLPESISRCARCGCCRTGCPPPLHVARLSRWFAAGTAVAGADTTTSAPPCWRRTPRRRKPRRQGGDAERLRRGPARGGDVPLPARAAATARCASTPCLCAPAR